MPTKFKVGDLIRNIKEPNFICTVVEHSELGIVAKRSPNLYADIKNDYWELVLCPK